MDTNDLENFILNGIVEVKAMSEDGRFLYGFTEDAKEIAPEVMDQVEAKFYSDIMYLWTNGFVDMDIMSENPTISITEKALDPEEVKMLGAKHLMTLTLVKNALKK